MAVMAYFYILCMFYGFSGCKSEELSNPHRGAEDRDGFFSSIQDYAITLVFKTLRVLDAFSCVSACLKEPSCQSVNFDTSGHPKHLCEFSQKSLECDTDYKELRPGFIHYFAPNKNEPCRKAPCKNGGTCEPACNEQGYRCKCGAFNKGQNCQLWTVPVSSCNDIFSKTSYRTDMAYTYMIDNKQTDIYCHLSSDLCGSRGWTLVMKTDGSKNTFAYDSALWSNKNVYDLSAGQTGLDNRETKMPSYWAMSFTNLCFGMKVGNNLKWVLLRFTTPSLHYNIYNGRYMTFYLGRSQWISLIEGASLQFSCDSEGFNVGVVNALLAHARIGMVADDQSGCLTPDSVLGFGLHRKNLTCGNVCFHNCSNGNKQIAAFGYILIKK